MATSGTLAPYPRHQFFDTNGDPLASGTLETYLAGTSTAVATYSDVGLTTANPTTITFNAAGRPSVSGTEVAIYLTPGVSYKWIVKNAAGSTIWTQDNITAVPPGTVTLDVDGTAGETLAAFEIVYMSDGSGARTAGRWYKADADLTYGSSSLILVGMVPAGIASGSTGLIRLSGRTTGLSGLTAGAAYYVSATAGAMTTTAPVGARFLGVAESTTTFVQVSNPHKDALPSRCEGRLTLTTATPVTTADVTAAGTIYFTPYHGNRVSLFDGTRWTEFIFTERSLALTATSGLPYDVFLYDNAGTLTLETTAWTNATTRATALTTQDGVYVKTGALTRRYLGTFYATGANVTEDSYANRCVWNAQNRVARPLRVLEATNSWAYSTATWRQMNGAAGNQVAIVAGLSAEAIRVQATANASNSASVSIFVAIGLDSASAPATGSFATSMHNDGGVAGIQGGIALFDTIPAVGYHYYPALEYATATGTTTWYGDNAGVGVQSGISAMWSA